MITLIAAHDKNLLIGNENKLPWHIPEDLKHFKRITKHKNVVMGRKTFESIILYLGKPLPDRHTIVLTRDSDFSYEGVEVFNDINLLLKKYLSEDIYVAGGEQIYNLFLEHAHFILSTEVDNEYLGDTYFPNYREDFEKFDYSGCLLNNRNYANSGVKYNISLYVRKNKEIFKFDNEYFSILKILYHELFEKNSRYEIKKGWFKIVLNLCNLILVDKIKLQNKIKFNEYLIYEELENDELKKQLTKENNDYLSIVENLKFPKIHQINQKFGELMILLNSSNDNLISDENLEYIKNCINSSSTISKNTCENCGMIEKFLKKEGNYLCISCNENIK